MNTLPCAGALRRAFVLAALYSLGSASAHAATGPKWQPSYATALKQAGTTGRPILLVVGTDNCHWCRQLEAKSLAAAEVVPLLNDRYIAYKLDAEKEAHLAAALKVKVYPSLYFASSSGQIASYHEGFLEADKLKDRLVTVLASVGTPDWMQRDFEMAGEAIKAGNPSRALALLRGVAEDGKSRPVQVTARTIIARMEKDAAAEGEKAKKLAVGGKAEDAIEALKGLDRSYPGTPAAREGKQLLLKLVSRSAEGSGEKPTRAKDLLEAARKDLKERRYLSCLERCEALSSYPGTPEADEGEKIARELKANTDRVKEMVAELGERQAMLLLALADDHARKGEPLEATHCLERIVRMFPASAHAETARARLARIKGKP